MDPRKPLEGLKVVELASVLAGPATGMFFAELGAEVIKIENPKTGGDVTRQWKNSSESSTSVSAYYSGVNWGKQVLFLDLTLKNDLTQLYEILKSTDILLMNFKAGDAEKFELEYQNLSGKFPNLICGYITGYGEKDKRPAFDLVMQAESGFMSMNGTQESGPLKMPVAIIDLMAAHQLKEGILTALFLRTKSGKGNAVHVSLFDAAIASLANQASNFLLAGITPTLNGSLHPNIAPYGETYLCQDGRFIVLAIGTEKHFQDFCRAIGKPEILKYEHFGNNINRVINRIELNELIKPFFSSRTSSELEKIFLASEIPFGIIRNVDEVLGSFATKELILEHKTVKTAIFRLEF